MPDYDPKSIPILDDIIEGDLDGGLDGDLEGKSNSEDAEATEAGDGKKIPEQINTEQISAAQINADVTAAENIQDDSTLDLFDDSDATSTKHEPYITDTFFDDLKHDDDLAHDNVTGEDQEHDVQDSDGQDNKNQSHESALIDYHAEEDRAEDEASQDDIITINDEISAPAISSQAMAEVSPISLNSIVEDVVKQLMPDLEQQLRFLIKQALEEKLPEDIIDGISTKNDE
jgi:hypothetical protein